MALAVWDHAHRRPHHTATTNTLRRYLYAIAAVTALAAAAGTGAGPLPVIGGFLLNAAITGSGPLALAAQLTRHQHHRAPSPRITRSVRVR